MNWLILVQHLLVMPRMMSSINAFLVRYFIDKKIDPDRNDVRTCTWHVPYPPKDELLITLLGTQREQRKKRRQGMTGTIHVVASHRCRSLRLSFPIFSYWVPLRCTRWAFPSWRRPFLGWSVLAARSELRRSCSTSPQRSCQELSEEPCRRIWRNRTVNSSV